MKFKYKFSNLLGTVYRSGDLLFTKDGNTLICPVGNKISMYDLKNNKAFTLPIEGRYNYRSLSLSPNGYILIAAQEDGELHYINLQLKTILYKKKLHGKIKNITFSPCGKYFALSVRNTVFVYKTPSLSRIVHDPFHMERVYPHCSNKIVCLHWSPDSRLLCYGSADMSLHIVGFVKFENLRDCLIGGNTDVVIGSYFQVNSYDLCTVTRNGHLSIWNCNMKADDLIIAKDTFKKKPIKEEEEDEGVQEEENNEDENKKSKKQMNLTYSRKSKTSLSQYLKKEIVKVTSTSYKPETRVMVVAFDSGDFLILDLSGDDDRLIHTLNISEKAINSVCINSSGDWIALGASSMGQIIVWEWQSETHVLKQQGHFNSMKVVSYSPDGLYLATGGDDGKVKIWSTQTSFCFVTFSEHTSEVTGVVFTQSGKAVLTSSLDGTVRAFDMIRYRNFKTLTSPKATQFSCLAVDSSGELVAAGGQDSHNIYLWSLQRGSLLEILGGHSGPVVSVQFSLRLGSTKLISTSWDKSVKVWDAIASTTAKETVSLLSDGTCVAFRPDGEQFAVATMNGQITLFNANTLRQECCIEGRNDLGAGQEDSDKISAKSNLRSNYFSTMSYSPDGSFIIAGGKSKYVCMYSVEGELLFQKFEITQNRSFDAMDKTIRRGKLTESGINLSLVGTRDKLGKIKVPGASKGALTERSYRPQIMVHGLTFSITGRSWAACCTEGVLIYSLDDDWLFDPIMLEISNTPNAVRKKLREKSYSMALMMACRLNMNSLIVEVIESIPPNSVGIVVDSLSPIYVELLMKFLPEMLESSQHVGFYTHWASSLVMRHGQALKARASLITPKICSLQKPLNNHSQTLNKVSSHNEYMLNFLLSQGALHQRKLSITEQKTEDSDDTEDEEVEDFEMNEDKNSLSTREDKKINSLDNNVSSSDDDENGISDVEMS